MGRGRGPRRGGRPMPPIGGGRPGIRPPKPPIGGGRPPIGGRPKPGRPFPGMPIGDDRFNPGDLPKGFFPIPGRPPRKPPVERHPWGREDDPNYAEKKKDWHQKRRPMPPRRGGRGGRDFLQAFFRSGRR